MRLLTVLLLLCSISLSAQPDYWALIQTNCPDYESARELRNQLVSEGHLVSLIYQPQWMVARLKTSAESVRGQHPQILAVGEGSGATRNLEAPPTLAAFFEKMAAGRFAPAERSKSMDFVPEGLAPVSCDHAESSVKNLTDDYELPNDYNSEYFRGVVATSVLFIESDGSDDPNYYSWTQEALEEEKLDVLMALHTWAYTAYLQGVDLSFIPVFYDSRPEVNQGFEPNLHFGSFDFYPGELSEMSGSVLRNLGYDAPYVRPQADNFNYDHRQAYAGDFAFTIGVHYSHEGRGYIRANANIGGPITYLSSQNDYRVYGHEIGHIFHALDEYLNTQSCDPSSNRFNGAINGNNISNECLEKETCVMNDNAVLGKGDQVHFAVCAYTAVHFGWTENTLPPPPQILTPDETSFSLPFVRLEVEFPAFRERLPGYVKIWRIDEGRDLLIISDGLGVVPGTAEWTNGKPLAPGSYKAVFYHGQKGQYALVPSETLHFDVDYTPVFSFRDTCLYFCQSPQPVSFPQENLRWYGDSGLRQLRYEGSEYLPDFNTDSTLYVAQYEGEEVVDVARVRFFFSRPASISVRSWVEGDGRAALSYFSFIPVFNVQSVQWYKDGEPIPGASDYSLYVSEPGAYSVSIYNGCQINSDTLQLALPPQLERTVLCDQGGYEVIVRGENIRWYDDRQNFLFSRDTLIVTNLDRFQFYYVTQTVDGVESPFHEVYLPPVNESERIDVLNTNGYLRVKSPSPTVDWWRNDTLFLADGPLEMTAPLPGLYRVSVRNKAGCPFFSPAVEVRFSTPPPTVEQDLYTFCQRDRSDVDDFEGPIVRAEGQDLRWYYEPELFEFFNRGDTYQVTYVDLKNRARFFITQTINGQESPPAVIFTEVISPIELSIDSLGEVLHAVVNGEDEQVLPPDYIFQWYRNDQPIPGSNSPWFYPEGEGGWYTADILNLTQSCLARDSVFIQFSTDTGETPIPEEVIVYPNPARDHFYIQFEQAQQRQILLYNSNGQLLRQLTTNDQILEVSMAGLPSGLYVVRCRMDNAGAELVRKVVKW